MSKITPRNSRLSAIVIGNDTQVKERAREYPEFLWDGDAKDVRAFLAKNGEDTLYSILVRRKV